MTIPLAIPVMMVCLTTTTVENNQGNHSTVASISIEACTPCKDAGKPCPLPPEFEALAKKLNAPDKSKPSRKDARK